MGKPRVVNFEFNFANEKTRVGKLQFLFRFITRYHHQLDGHFRKLILSHLATIRVPVDDPVGRKIQEEIFFHTDTWVDEWMAIITSSDPFYTGNDPYLQSCYAILV